jgi:hypothetical protein
MTNKTAHSLNMKTKKKVNSLFITYYQQLTTTGIVFIQGDKVNTNDSKDNKG